MTSLAFRNTPMRTCLILSPLLVLVGGCATSGASGPTTVGDGGGASSSGGSGSGSGGSGSSTGSGSSSGSSGGSTGSSGGSGAGASSGSSSGPADSGGLGSQEAGHEAGGADGGCASGAPAIQDDFEGASLSAWQLTDPFGNPIPMGSTQYSVAIDSTRAHSGTHAIKVHNGGLFGMAPPASAFYGRVWQLLGSTPGTIPSGGHWGSIIGVGPSEGGQPVEVRMGGQFGILIDNYSSNDDVILSAPNFFNGGMDAGTSPTVGTWACVEFYFGKDSLRTWSGGSEVTSLNVTPATTWAHGMKAPWSPEYSSIRIGYANYNANAIDVWYDDVAIDTKRMCCP